jgi:hypothetical protein
MRVAVRPGAVTVRVIMDMDRDVIVSMIMDVIVPVLMGIIVVVRVRVHMALHSHDPASGPMFVTV